MIEINSLKRNFLPADFKITTWDHITPYADDLIGREINSLEDFTQFLKDENELSTILKDEDARREVQKTLDINDKEAKERYEYFVEHIKPSVAVYSDKLSKKIVASHYAAEYEEPGFAIYLRGLQDNICLFREENISLDTEVSLMGNEVDNIQGNWQVEMDGENLTLSDVDNILSGTDRAKREKAWQTMTDVISKDNDKLDKIFDEMFGLRAQIGKNADFKNYRDYKFLELGRYDYTVDDCRKFHNGIAEHVVPLIREMYKSRKELMGIDTLYPYDLAVDPLGRPALVAFKGGEDFLNKTQEVFDKTDPFFGDAFRASREAGQVDAMARPGKQQNAYMTNFYESNIPFIFMNGTNNADDIVTMAHEGGHAIHEVSMAKLPMIAYRSYPSEIAELGSMTMELVTMDNWDVFFNNKEDLFRAQREHLEGIIISLPWISMVDEFQEDIYEQVDPTIEGRQETWIKLNDKYSTNEVEAESGLYSGHPWRNNWRRQLHIFNLPFYYIDYGVAQMGALQVWRNYKQDPEKALTQYKDAMALGYTKSLPEVYEAAGVKFDFSPSAIKELMDFVGTEITNLREQEMIEYKKNNPAAKPE
jgi:oligoendopeptidase F